MGRFDVSRVPGQARFPLRRFASDEAEEVVKPVAGRPAVEGPHAGRFGSGRVVPLSKRRCFVAVVMQHLSHRGRFLGHDAGEPVKRDSSFGDRARADARVVAAGQQRRSRR